MGSAALPVSATESPLRAWKSLRVGKSLKGREKPRTQRTGPRYDDCCVRQMGSRYVGSAKMQDSKFKIQNAKVKTEDARQNYQGEAAGVLAFRPAAVYGARKSKFRMSALLFFAFCVLTFAFALPLLPTALHAQGCAMCYTSASAARSTAKEALANGTLILLIPPMVFFALITVVVYRYRNRFREMSVVSGPLSVARRSNDRESWRSDEPSAEAPDVDFWSPNHPIIRSPDSLPRATDN